MNTLYVIFTTRVQTFQADILVWKDRAEDSVPPTCTIEKDTWEDVCNQAILCIYRVSNNYWSINRSNLHTYICILVVLAEKKIFLAPHLNFLALHINFLSAALKSRCGAKKNEDSITLICSAKSL